MRCTATNRKGRQCTKPAVEGRKVCFWHGGASPKAGPTHHRYKHGKYSKWVPPSIRGRFDELMADPNLLELRGQVAMLTVRYWQLVSRLDTGETGSLFGDLRHQWAVFQSARQAGVAQAEALDAIGQLIRAGGEQNEVWDAIMRICREIQRATRAELERMALQHAFMTYAESIELMNVVAAEIIAEIGQHVQGPVEQALRQGIARRLDRYLSPRPRPALMVNGGTVDAESGPDPKA